MGGSQTTEFNHLTIGAGVTLSITATTSTMQVKGTLNNLGNGIASGTHTVEFTGTSSAVAGDAIVFDTLALGASAALTLDGTDDVGVGQAMTVAVGETLRLQAMATLRLAVGITVQGSLETSGTSASSRPTITRSGSGNYAFSISGTVDMSYYNVYYTDATGMQLAAGATVTSLDHGTFDLQAGGTADTYAGRSSLLNFPSWDDGSTLSLHGCTFRNTAEASYAANIKSNTAWTSGSIEVYGYGGDLSGANYENEDTGDDWIIWSTGAKSVQVTSGSAAGYYATIQDALNGPDGTAGTADDAANTELRIVDNTIHDISSTITLSANNANVVFTRGLLRWTGTSGGNIFDGSGAAGEIWRNCMIYGNNPTLATCEYIQNCTIDGSANGGTTYTNVLSTGTLTATTETTCLESVASNYFIGASRNAL